MSEPSRRPGTLLWVDEAGSIVPAPHSHMTDALAYSMAAVSKHKVSPHDVPCRYCGADAGNPCLRWRRTWRGKVRKPRPHYHPDRVYDARIATEAVNALNPL